MLEEDHLASRGDLRQLTCVTAPAFRFIGHGLYALSEAERLTGIPRRRIRRWLEGYTFTSGGRRHSSDPIVSSDLGRETGELALSFADLIEIRFLDAFLEHGVSWRSIRIAAGRAKEILLHTHPFSTRRFKTDGRDILAEIVRPGGVPELLNLVRNQWELERVVSPMLYAGLDFSASDEPERWWPMTRKKSVVIDPRRSFGAPIISDVGVPTRVLAASARAEGTQRMTARIYAVPLRAVRHAVEYESRFLA